MIYDADKMNIIFLSVWGCSHSPNACNHNYFKTSLHYMTVTTILLWAKLRVIKEMQLLLLSWKPTGESSPFSLFDAEVL